MIRFAGVGVAVVGVFSYAAWLKLGMPTQREERGSEHPRRCARMRRAVRRRASSRPKEKATSRIQGLNSQLSGLHGAGFATESLLIATLGGPVNVDNVNVSVLPIKPLRTVLEFLECGQCGVVSRMGSAASAKVAGASTKDLKEVANGMSEDERQKLLAAIAQLESESAPAAQSLEAILGQYNAHASDGDWGSYSITVTIKADASMMMYTSSCDFRDSPETITTTEGSGALEGEILTFTSTKVCKEQQGTGAMEPKTKDETETYKFKLQPDGSLAMLRKDGTVDEIQGGYGGDPKPAILRRR